MRFVSLPAALFVTALIATPTQAGIWSVINGNDTGGIIPWSPQLRAYGYREAAQHHCGGYKKIARVTSVVAGYGNFVGFACEFPRDYDPVKRGAGIGPGCTPAWAAQDARKTARPRQARQRGRLSLSAATATFVKPSNESSPPMV